MFVIIGLVIAALVLKGVWRHYHPLPVEYVTVDVGACEVVVTFNDALDDAIFKFEGDAFWNSAFGICPHVAIEKAKSFINGTKPILVNQIGYIPRRRIAAYAIRNEAKHEIQVPKREHRT